MATIEITHTRADGTLLTGSCKGDGAFEIVRPHGFWPSRSLGCLYIRQSRDKDAQMWRINAAAEALRSAGHEVTVTVNEEVRRSFAEAEAARQARAEDRAERFGDRAGRAAASADARRTTADRIAARFEGGQPILVGHHSEGRARRDMARMHTAMRKSFEDSDRATYWANRTQASENYAQHRTDPHRTLRRLERLRADLRTQQRHHAEAVENGWDSADRHARLILDLTDEITYWEQIVEKAKAEGVKIWGAQDFAPGDFVRYLGSWYQVARVNAKTLSIAWNLRLAPKQVMSLEDATFDGGRIGTHTADYTQVRARCPEAAMTAFLADAKVPGIKSADAASLEQPASAVREAQAAKRKPRKRTSARPVEPKRESAAVPGEQPIPEPAVEEQPAPETERAPEPEPARVWGRADFTRGDFVQTGGCWYQVLRSNPRSVSVPGEPYLIQWAMVTGRRTAAEMAEALAVETGEDQAPVDAPLATCEEQPQEPEKTASDLRFSSSNPVPQGSPSVRHSVHTLTPTLHSERPETMTTTTAPTAPTAKTVQRSIPTDRIDRDPTQPREEFDHAKLEELAGSMRKLGQLQPISVRYIPATRRYTLVMGERRWRAAQMAGLTEMTALVLHGIQEGARETLAKQVAENVGRADMTAMEEAKSFKRLEDAEYTVDEIAEMCGKSPAYIGWRIDLLRLCAPAQEALSKGHLPVGMAWYVAQLSCDNQVRFLSRYARGGFANDRDAQAFVQAARAEEQRRESQGSFFVLADETTRKGDIQESILGEHDVPEEERERIAAERSKLTKKIERLSTAGEILAELATTDPEELALLLAGAAGGIEAHSKRIGHLRKLTGQVIATLTKAQAIAAVRAGSIEINPAAVASTDAA